MKEKEKEKIHGSGLFFFNSNLNDSEKLKLVDWYKGLNEEDRKNVDILRNEASDETEFFSQEDEDI